MTDTAPLNPFLARELLARADQAAERWARRVRDQLDDVHLGQYRLVGPEAARAAWRLALHADDHPDFQLAAAHLLRRAVDAGDAPMDQWVRLHDRALLNTGSPQEFGTQYRLWPQGPQACAVRDPDGLDARRAKAGLPSATVALTELRERLATPPSREATSDTIVRTALAGAA
ncbi:DUF6624 domain-containing protein [Streptomyces sp. NPDC001296]